ncbi:MAG: hypothetical protein OXU68_06300 [Bacteroidota bacterium]|nr:hypothetical protein [Bacteroidota bacterium]
MVECLESGWTVIIWRAMGRVLADAIYNQAVSFIWVAWIYIPNAADSRTSLWNGRRAAKQ